MCTIYAAGLQVWFVIKIQLLVIACSSRVSVNLVSFSFLFKGYSEILVSLSIFFKFILKFSFFNGL